MRALIVNADDFGLSRGVTDGIVDAHRHGVVTSTSLMVNRPAAEYAAVLARDDHELSVGMHFEDDTGELDDPVYAERKFRAQLDRFRELMGSDPTHVDSHHHVHLTRRRPATFKRLVEPLGVPLRRTGQVGYIGGFYGQWQPGVTDLSHVSRAFLLELVATEVSDGFTELACHPARATGDFSSSYVHEREAELETLTSPGLREEIAAAGATLVSYRAWRG